MPRALLLQAKYANGDAETALICQAVHEWHSLGGVLASGPVAAVTLNQFGSLEVYPNLTLTER